jgi:hypothetical protein
MNEVDSCIYIYMAFAIYKNPADAYYKKKQEQ